MSSSQVGTKGSALLFMLLVIGGSLTPVCGAESADSEELMNARIASGEFAPALKSARETKDLMARDRWLAKIAAAQAQAGQRRDALTVLEEVNDSRLRYSAVKNLETSSAKRPARGNSSAGGGSQADFDALIELIVATIAPQSWDEVGGPGSISEFEGGIRVDADGVLRKIVREDDSARLAELRMSAAADGQFADARRKSQLRKVSLTRLEKHLQLLAAAGRRPTEEMEVLAGLERIQYVLVYPEQREIVLAGPAGDWRPNADGRLLAVDSGHPVVRLDDLIVMLRNVASQQDHAFGCSITPTQEGLARTQAFVKQSAAKPLRPGQRKSWLDEVRANLGRQDVTVYGIDPRTRIGRLMVEADYHMKLIGIGLEEGTLGVTSYLDAVKVPKGAAPPPMDVLRWYFTLNYQAVKTTPARNAFELSGQGVQVLSENELLTQLGERVHTGKSNELNAEFAHQFTKHFPALAAKYPVYGELQNAFDLALVASLIESEQLPEKIQWDMAALLDPDVYQPQLGPAPTQVETVMNHRIINKVHILAAVSGGVRARPQAVVSPDAIKVDEYGLLKAGHAGAKPGELSSKAWWWD